MSTPRIAAIHDLSCFGRCSLTIALPVLSAMGCQCCPLPTALLSAHTGFSGNTFLALTVEMGRIADHWAAMDLQFDAIYSGFLGSADQVDTVARFFDTFKKSGTAVIVDPVMGDHGTAYRTCTPDLCRGMRALAENADVITPNLTEAALLLDRPYEEIQRTDAYEVVRQLSLGGRRSVVLTGYSSEPGQTGALCFCLLYTSTLTSSSRSWREMALPVRLDIRTTSPSRSSFTSCMSTISSRSEPLRPSASSAPFRRAT